jgi:predicted alpha/beta-hydrolase family hydrolase
VLATTLELDTPHGVARAHVHGAAAAADPPAALVLGHGAGGSVTAPDLVAATEAAGALGATVVLVEQPYRVAGRRSPAPAKQLDAAWTSVVDQLRDGGGPLANLPLVAGGRSSGARVACRTAAATGAIAVLCLAFPLHTPAGKDRLDELDGVTVPTLVVQGERDRFGVPPAGPQRTVAVVRGDHALKADTAAVAAAVTDWLPRVVR